MSSVAPHVVDGAGIPLGPERAISFAEKQPLQRPVDESLRNRNGAERCLAPGFGSRRGFGPEPPAQRVGEVRDDRHVHGDADRLHDARLAHQLVDLEGNQQ